MTQEYKSTLKIYRLKHTYHESQQKIMQEIRLNIQFSRHFQSARRNYFDGFSQNPEMKPST